MANEASKRIFDRPASMGGDVQWSDTARTYEAFHGNTEALRRDLTRRVDGEVRFDSATKGAYSTDASNYRQVPLGVVLPKTVEAMAEAVAVCYKHGAPITHRGGGTSLAGQCCNNAVVIDGSKYCDRILEINAEQRYARVEPGVRRDQLTKKTEAEHNLTFAPDTSTHEYATFGGMIGNNACGVHSQMARRTQDNIEEMEILLYDGTRMRVGATPEDELQAIIESGGRKGEIYRRLRDLRDEYADLIRERYPDIPRRVSGYNLTEVLPERGFNVARALVGTEGTCVSILEATVKLVESPPERALLVTGFTDVYAAGDHVVQIGELGPIGLEGIDAKFVGHVEEDPAYHEHLQHLPEGGGYLIAEFGGYTLDEAKQRAAQAQQEIEQSGWNDLIDLALVADPEAQEMIWEVREAGLGVTAHQPAGIAWPGWEDSAIPPEATGDYMRDLRELYDKYGYDAALYGHFGQACVHTRIPFDLQTREGLETYREFIDEASDLCAKYGGSFSAEHGDGQARAEMLPKMFGEELIEAFREFKRIWDPDWKMNPGKLIDPYKITENLRLGTDYHPVEPETRFAYPEDNGSFAHAALRCAGVGKCRRMEMSGDQVMCPSFLATREEVHTTRGRARLLFEMLNEPKSPDVWDNEDVHEALDLCLSCKGCKNDCPVNVDMATYKAEFLSHYYERHLRPRHAYVLGLIHWWARLASYAPRVANFFLRAPGFSTAGKAIAGIAQQREMPTFATETFRQWFERRTQPNTDRPPVMLFPDTFHNYLKPETAKAAVAVLEDAGYRVLVPDKILCCGRPLYEFGWIDMTKRLWEDMLASLRDHYREDLPIVGLEPSCVAAFRDELPNLFPNDTDAQRLTENTYTLGEFLADHADNYEPPHLERRALLHGHCHHLAIMGIDGEREILQRMGVEYEMPGTSCCGMAGAFGYEAEHYDISMKAAEHKLLPAVREAEDDVLLITDGYSCREQIEQSTGRRALHLAEVIDLALRQNNRAGDLESRAAQENGRDIRNILALTKPLIAGTLAGTALTAYLLWCR